MSRYVIFLLIFIGFLSNSAHAAWTIKNGSIVDADEVATMSMEEHYSIATEAYMREDWSEAARHFCIVSCSFSNTPCGQDAAFYLGICYFNLQEYDFANQAFTKYITSKNHPTYFLEAIQYKYSIAECFRAGAKCRFFGTKQLPKWASGNEHAHTIYDEVAAALPTHELAAQALYSKACLHWQNKQYRESIDNFQMVCRRFPRHELAPQSYLNINRVYLEQSQVEFQNPDILAFAQINLRRFKQDFPREERIAEAEYDVLAIKEVYAQGLYDTGQFYERIHKPRASVIYYQNAFKQFPETSVAQLCLQRLYCLCPGFTPPQPKAETFDVEDDAGEPFVLEDEQVLGAK